MMSAIARRTSQPGAIAALPAVAGATSGLLGIALLTGWELDALAWLRLPPELALLPAKTAVGFVLAGGCLLALHRGVRLLTAILAGLLSLYSLLLLGQCLMGIGLGVDAILFGQRPASISPPEGLAVTMAVTFALSGLAFFTVRQRGFMGALLGSTILVVGAVTCFGYAVGLPRAFGWDAQTRLPLLVGFGFLVQGGGMVAFSLLTDWRAGRHSGWWKSAMVGAIAAVAGVLVWQGLQAREVAHARGLVHATAQGVGGELKDRMQFIADALTSLGRHGDKVGWHSREDWQTDARLSFGPIRGFETIEWIDPAYVSRVLAAMQDTPRALAATAESDSLRLQALREARRTFEPIIAGPFPFEDGGLAFRVLVPVVSSGRINAYMSGVFSTQGAFAPIAENVAPGYALVVLCQGNEVFRSDEPDGRDASPWQERARVDLPGTIPWSIAVTPRPELAAALNTPLPDVALGASLLLAFLLTLAVRIGEMATLRAQYFEIAVRERTTELEESMSTLRGEVAERRRSEDALRRTQTISRQMSAELDVHKLLQAVTDAARDLTGAGCVAFACSSPPGSVGAVPEHTLSPPGDGAAKGLLAQVMGTSLLRATLVGQEIVRRADLREDPRYRGAAPGGDGGAPERRDGGAHTGAGARDDHVEPMVSYLAAPIVSRSGAVSGVLLLGHPRAGVFTQREEEIVTALAAQAAIAMDNARLYEAERRANAEATAASEAKDIYIHTLGHELRNPLGSISNALEIQSLRPGDSATQERMRAILGRQVARLARIIDDLLEVSRIASGKLTLRLERCDLCHLVREAYELAQPRVESAGLLLECEVPKSPVWADIDPLRFAQVLDNLVSNSINFTDPGGRIALRVFTDEPALQAFVTVADTGCGIEPEQLARVFEAFVQTSEAQQRRTGGLGLGLSIVKGLVEAHGGGVQLRSEGRGRGCAVTLHFPLRAEAALPAGRLAEVGQAPPRRVLVIDDHRDSADGLRELLELYGHAVRVAYDGHSGLDAARAFSPDIVICDIGLPGLDGYAVARELRRETSTAGARLLALTGFGDEGTAEQIVAAGFESHLTKPVEPAMLRQILAAPAPGRLVREQRA
jgi:signal transduction histidine kinase/sensor domain CHASE-containing protein/ActR/RegA family two-component response regulator